MTKKIGIIGSNSFSGLHLIKMCDKLGYETYGVSRYSKDRVSCTKHLKADINVDPMKIKCFLENSKLDAVINISALATVQESWNHPGDYFRTNCASISDIVNNLKVKRFLQISTPEVYGSKLGSETTRYNPSTPYATSKAMFDTYLMLLYKNFDFPVLFVRPCNWFGPYQQLYKIIPKTIIKIKKKEILYLDGGGLSSRNFIYVEDVCEGISKIINRGKKGQIYHVTTEKDITIKNLVKTICGIMDYRYEDLVINRQESRIGKDTYYNLDSSKIKEELNWKPKFTLEEGIKKTIDWIEDDWKNIRNASLEYEYR